LGKHKALKAGFIDFIGKPAMPMRVIARINRPFALIGNMQHTHLDDTPPALVNVDHPEMKNSFSFLMRQ
jgi:FixJ family two-component response regulator